jgi:hypothetical protein
MFGETGPLIYNFRHRLCFPRKTSRGVVIHPMDNSPASTAHGGQERRMIHHISTLIASLFGIAHKK